MVGRRESKIDFYSRLCRRGEVLEVVNSLVKHDQHVHNPHWPLRFNTSIRCPITNILLFPCLYFIPSYRPKALLSVKEDPS